MAFMKPAYGGQQIALPTPGTSPVGASLDWGGIYNTEDPAEQGLGSGGAEFPHQSAQISPFGNTLVQRGRIRPRNWQQSQQALFAALGDP